MHITYVEILNLFARETVSSVISIQLSSLLSLTLSVNKQSELYLIISYKMMEYVSIGYQHSH